MRVLASTTEQLTASDVYDTFSSSLYGMILKTSASSEEAENILISTFEAFFQQKPVRANRQNNFMLLLQIAIHIIAQKTNLSKQAIVRVMLKGLTKAGIPCIFIAASLG